MRRAAAKGTMSEPVFPKVTVDDGLIPDDWSCWVVADVHGAGGGLVEALARAGISDRAGRWTAPRKTALVLLGDMVGRGPDTLGVLRLIEKLSIDCELLQLRFEIILG